MNGELLLKLKEVYSILEDDGAKDIYLNRLSFLMAGDYDHDF